MAKGVQVDTFETKPRIDRLRASMAGHAFHEAWAARSALELLPPNTTLTAIAIEGLSLEDSSVGGAAADEIADLTRYHGHRSVAKATRVEVVQFKYSTAFATTAMRAADIAKTLRKFTETDLKFIAAHGNAHVQAVVRYNLTTNRPIHENLDKAIASLITGEAVSGDVEKQAKQLAKAIKEGDGVAPGLLSRLTLSGNRGSLKQADQSVRSMLAAWGEASDPDARTRLLQLRSLIRDKAGPDGEGNNVIDRIAVIGEIVGIEHERELYPIQDAFPPVSHPIGRPAVQQIVAASRAATLPLIVHGAGGMGKTVLMQAVSDALRETDHVVIFDGYGAGKWRAPEDGRHRPERTLVHLANLFAGQGLCDLLLPISDSVSLMRAFRKRLEQAATAARQAAPEAGITLVLDAIDHAGLEAESTHSTSFAHDVLKSLAIDPINGVKVIGSCRTERIEIAVADAAHEEFELPPFTIDEVRQLVLARDPTATASEVAALKGRSGGNPRCLDALLIDGRPYDGLSAGEEADPEKLLDTLIEKRIAAAREEAFSRGGKKDQIDLLLAGLALLPPPVPIEELAASHGLTESAVESFIADLSPLLERTPFGIMFRDEPTETLITDMARSDEVSRNAVVAALANRQSVSDYAARALPFVLTALRRTDELVELAFDARMPPGASKVSQRDIRLARLTAALSECAKAARHDDLMRLLLEASIVAAGHERSDRFLYEYPDLAAVSADAEALRRLFATRVGWPGGRHSALSIAYAFGGLFDEAERNAQRTLDWLEWAASNRRSDNPDRRELSRELDDVGFAYVKLLTGDEARVVRWFGSRPESAARSKFGALFDLLNRHAQLAAPIAVTRTRLLKKLGHCRSKNRGFWTAALSHFGDDAVLGQQIVSRLSRLAFPDGDENKLRHSMPHAAARALVLGMRTEGLAIFGPMQPRGRFYDFHSQWPIEERPEYVVFAAGVRAALLKRKPTLFDVVPEEFLALVPPSIRNRGPRAFAKDLAKRLAPTRIVRRKRSTAKENAQRDNREEYARGLQYRIEPLVALAAIAANILSPPKGSTARDALASGLDELEHEVSKASNYPYRDGKEYMARMGFNVIFDAAMAGHAFDDALAQRAVAWLAKTPSFHTPTLTKFVERLSRHAALHNAALALANHIETLIARDTDTSSRISAFGNLARAVWRVSPAEARAYFRRALDLTDAMGSDEYDRTNDLFELAGQYEGEPLAAGAIHSLARVFELNLYEARKYPWIEFGNAMARTAGAPAIAIIARMDDREVADVSWSLAPMLTALLSVDRIPSELATCIVGLDQQVETWTWSLHTFATAAIKRLPIGQRDFLFATILREIDREDRLSPFEDTIQGLLSLAEANLPKTSANSARIRAIADRVGTRARSESSSSWAVDPSTYATFDQANPDEIDRAIETCDLNEAGQQFPMRVLRGLAEKARSPAERLDFIRAVAASNGADLSTKLLALEDEVATWSATSAAIRDELPLIAAQLATKHAEELVSSDWEASSSWRRLTGVFRGDKTALALEVIVSLSPSAIAIGGASWLGLANKVAPVVTPTAYKDALERFLTQAGEKIPDDFADGKWTPAIAVENDAAAVTASLIWTRLGNLHAASRWRAAHAVRYLASVGRFDVIDQIVAKFDDTSAGAFSDASLPFYYLHARLWLLIALARLAQDFPAEMSKYLPRLEAVALDKEFPHVPMQAFAQSALRSIATVLVPSDAARVLTVADAVNVPKLPRQAATHKSSGMYQARPDGQSEPENSFYLDYDFNKYQVSDVCETFDCGEWEVRDGITRWVHQWDADATSMYVCPRVSNDRRGSWTSSPPEVDRYGGYLGWHALMVVAGEMMATRAVTGRSWRDDPFEEFLHGLTLSRKDGRWLSDVTDLFPLDLKLVDMPEHDTKQVDPLDHAILGPTIGLTPGEPPTEQVVVWGHWNAGTNVSMGMQSVLIEAASARAAAYAVLMDRRFSQYLPSAVNDDYHSREYGDLADDVLGWGDRPDFSNEALDRHDPYASSTASRRSKPPEWLSSAYGLTPLDSIDRSWAHSSEPVVLSEAWGTKGGYGERSWDDDGDWLKLNWPFLQSVLKQEDKVLLGFIKARIYYPDRKSDVNGEAFAHRTSAFILDTKGGVKFISRIPRGARNAVDCLKGNDRFNFKERFSAIRKAMAR